MESHCFHATAASYMCKVCGVVFDHEFTLNIHSLVHKKELEFDSRHVKNKRIKARSRSSIGSTKIYVYDDSFNGLFYGFRENITEI